LTQSGFLAAAFSVATAGGAVAEPQEVTISVIGAPSSVNAWNRVQKSFFNETLPQASGGKIAV
jgi:hypothetical protein